MSPLVKKEIRLLLPSWVAAMALAVAPPWLFKYSGDAGTIFMMLLWAGVVLLAVSAFGRESSAGTFSLLLSQPSPRALIWRTKASVLAFALLSVFSVFVFNDWCASVWSYSHRLTLLICGVFILAAYSGGLWTTLLFRQVAAALWITLLVPIAFWISTTGSLREFGSANAVLIFRLTVLAVYAVAGFFLARRLFFRAQDVNWTGGTITFPVWRSSESQSQPSVPMQRQSHIAALFRKELQLHQVSLLCAAGLFVMHLGVMVLRKVVDPFEEGALLEVFWSVWLVVPLIIGGMAVAEERKLDVMESQLCLPVSRGAQFVVKLFVVLVLGGLLSAALLWAAERFGVLIRVKDIFGGTKELSNPATIIGISAVFLALSMIAFFASTLSRNILQALATAVAIIIGICFVMVGAATIAYRPNFAYEITLWHGPLIFLITVPMLAITFLWLAYQNFKTLHDNWRTWRRNIFGLMGAVVFSGALTTTIYYRVWEVFEPAEPAHGMAKLSLSAPPKLHSDSYRDLLIQLPDGRVWFDGFHSIFDDQESRWSKVRWLFASPLPKSAGPQQFIPGSNWASVTAQRVDWWMNSTHAKPTHITGYLDTIGIRRDGTLWISAESKPVVWTGAKMIRFGHETNWQQIVPFHASYLLLKTDGTLWYLGAETNRHDWSGWQTNWPSVRSLKPQRIGTGSNWKEIFHAPWKGDYARKSDGSVWAVEEDSKTGKNQLEHQTNLNRIVFQTLSGGSSHSMAYVARDGTLWACNLYWKGNKQVSSNIVQISKETNWVAVADCWNRMVALKSDGSLWKWEWEWNNPKSITDMAQIPPTRMSIHNDWVAIANLYGEPVSLAVDGSLWLWPTSEDYNMTSLLKPPKQPKLLGNIFDKQN